MLGKMIVHGLLAAGLVAAGGALYSASAADTGYVAAPATGTGTTTTAAAAPAQDNGYLPITAGKHHDRRRDDKNRDHEAREKADKWWPLATKSRRDHDDD